MSLCCTPAGAYGGRRCLQCCCCCTQPTWPVGTRMQRTQLDCMQHAADMPPLARTAAVCVAHRISLALRSQLDRAQCAPASTASGSGAAPGRSLTSNTLRGHVCTHAWLRGHCQARPTCQGTKCRAASFAARGAPNAGPDATPTAAPNAETSCPADAVQCASPDGGSNVNPSTTSCSGGALHRWHHQQQSQHVPAAPSSQPSHCPCSHAAASRQQLRHVLRPRLVARPHGCALERRVRLAVGS